MPNLKKLYQSLAGDERFVLIGLSRDNDAETAQRVATEAGMPWPNAALVGDNYEAATRYGVEALPASFLIGGDGRILARDLRGGQLETAVRAALEALRSSEE